MFCSPPVIEREYRQFHRSQVFDLVSDEDDAGSADQPLDGAYVYNGTLIIREVTYALIHKDEIPDVVKEMIGDGWSPQGELQMSPIVQGGDYYRVSMKLGKAIGL